MQILQAKLQNGSFSVKETNRGGGEFISSHVASKLLYPVLIKPERLSGLIMPVPTEKHTFRSDELDFFKAFWWMENNCLHLGEPLHEN